MKKFEQEKTSVLLMSGGRFVARIFAEMVAESTLTDTVDYSVLMHPGDEDERINSTTVTGNFRWPDPWSKNHTLRALGRLKQLPAGFLDRQLSVLSSPLSSAEIQRKRGYYRNYLRSLPEPFSIYHAHYIDEDLYPRLCDIPGEKLMLTFWGSDLMRCESLLAHTLQQRLVEHAKILTVCSLEQKEILLSRFGRKLEDKVRIAKFGSAMLSLIDERRNHANSFRNKFGIASSKTLVTVGNNASDGNQHLEILQTLAGLPAEYKANLHLVLPFTYGASAEGYRTNLEACAAKANLSTTFITERLTAPEVAELRLATDICIHLPISDAMSAAFTEAIYAGAIGIVGDWLPFGEFQRCGCRYHQVSDIQALRLRMQQIIDDLPAEKAASQDLSGNAAYIAHWPKVQGAWLELYREMLGSKT